MTPEEFYYLRKREPSKNADAPLYKKPSAYHKKSSIGISNDLVLKELQRLATKSRRTLQDYIRRIIEQAIATQQTQFSFVLDQKFEDGKILMHLRGDKKKEKKLAKLSRIKEKNQIREIVKQQIDILNIQSEFMLKLRGQYLYNKQIQTIVSVSTVAAIYKNRPKELKKILNGRHPLYKLKGTQISRMDKSTTMGGGKRYYDRNLPDLQFGK